MGGIGHYVPQRSGQRQSVNHSKSLTNIHFKIGVKVCSAVGVNMEEEKALGVYWDPKADQLYVKADMEKPSKTVKHGVPKVW